MKTFFLLFTDVFKGKQDICGPENHFLIFTDIFREKHELSVGMRKNLAIDFTVADFGTQTEKGCLSLA